MESNAKVIFDYLMRAYNNPYGVCALMGNLKAESGLNPKNLQNNYEVTLGFTDESYTRAVDSQTYAHFVRDCAGYGLAQWTYHTRKQALLEYTRAQNKSIGDLDAQLGFLVKEISGYPNVKNAIINAKTIKEASDVILCQYERPADQGAKAKEKRASFGQEYYNEFVTNKEPVNNTVLPYRVKVAIPDLNIRKGAGTNYAKTGAYTGVGVFTIVEEKSGKGSKNGWGKLKSGAGWIALDYTTKL